MQYAIVDGHVCIRRNDVYGIRGDGDAFGYLNHRHSRRFGKQFRKDAFMLRRQMLDQHECHPRIHWQRREQLFKCLETAGRGADADYGIRKRRDRRGDLVGSSHTLRLRSRRRGLVLSAVRPALFLGWPSLVRHSSLGEAPNYSEVGAISSVFGIPRGVGILALREIPTDWGGAGEYVSQQWRNKWRRSE